MLQTNRDLQKEQITLFAIQKKLQKVLPIVQEALNSLKVEELHLKSLGLQSTFEGQGTPANDPLRIDFQDSRPSALESQQINQQEIDLDLYTSRIKRFDEESDSD